MAVATVRARTFNMAFIDITSSRPICATHVPVELRTSRSRRVRAKVVCLEGVFREGEEGTSFTAELTNGRDVHLNSQLANFQAVQFGSWEFGVWGLTPVSATTALVRADAAASRWAA